MVQPDLLLNTVVTADKCVIEALTGDWWEAKMEGCRFYAGRFSVTIREKADMIIFFCGGLSQNINFIQAHKSMEYGSHALRKVG